MESVLEDVDQCGMFQVCLTTLVQLCRFFSSWGFSVMIFGLYNPGWRCVKRNTTDTFYNASLNPAFYRNAATLSTIQPLGFHEIEIEKSIDTDHRLSESYVYNDTCDVIDSCDSIEFNPSSSTVISEFGLVCDKVWIAFLIVSVLSVGMVIGAFVWGEIGERFGRKTGLYGSNFVMTLSCGLAIFSPNWQVYALFNFLIGFGLVGIAGTSSPLCMEYLNSDWRARLASVPVWNSAVVVFALITFVLRDWRYIHLVSALALGVSCLGFLWTPESLRWLVLHRKTARAQNVIEKISKLNKKLISVDSLREIATNYTDKENFKRKHYTYLDLFKTPQLRSIVIKLSSIFIVISVAYDLIGFALQSLPGDFYTNMIIASLIEFPGTVVVGILASTIGRRLTGVLFVSSGALCCATIVTSLTALEKSSAIDLLISIVAFINRSLCQGLVNLMMTYTAELVPTAVRNLTFGFLFFVGRIVSIGGTFLLPRDQTSMIACFAVLMGIQIIATLAFIFLPETKNRPIGDTIPVPGNDSDTDDV